MWFLKLRVCHRCPRLPPLMELRIWATSRTTCRYVLEHITFYTKYYNVCHVVLKAFSDRCGNASVVEYDKRPSRTRPQHASPTALHAWAAANVPAGQPYVCTKLNLKDLIFISKVVTENLLCYLSCLFLDGSPWWSAAAITTAATAGSSRQCRGSAHFI